jgi:hypothetical protein
MIVKTITENEDGTATITCDFTAAEISACVEVGFLRLLEEYLKKNAPFHEGNTDAKTPE